MTRIDPLTYGIDAMRNLLLDASEFRLVVSLAVLCVASVIFIALGSYSFSKIQI